MKAKIKATEEIRDICEIGLYSNGDGIDYFEENEIEIIPNQPEVPVIDWEQRRYEIAKEVMNGFVVAIFGSEGGIATISKYDNPEEVIAKMAIGVTDELIHQLKNTPMK